MSLLLCLALTASNTINVVGRRGEVEREDRPGKSLVIRPEDPTRFDAQAQLSKESSLALPETGRITAQGFAVPRVRGQDTRLTEVYVDDMLLQDPYSGLPLVDELDLRAFGEIAVYQGAAPVTLPTLNGIGIVQYRVRPSAKPSSGLTVGKPYGVSAWSLAKGDDLRVYARRHVTDGRYDYYSDNGTPYNTTDDRHETRTNNHRSSTQFMLFDRSQIGADSEVKVLLLSQESRTGLPTLNANLPSLAEQRATTRVASLAGQRSLGEHVISLKLSGHADDRKTTDPSHATLSTAEETGFRASAAGRGVSWDAAPGGTFTRLSFDQEDGTARVTSDDETPVEVSRSTDKVAWGSTLEVGGGLKVEAKAVALELRDRLGSARRTTRTQGASLATEFRAAGYSVYLQGGANRRAPSLLEEFGDGGTVLDSSGVHPERARHAELGATAAGFGLAVFEDDTHERITLVPALANTLRATNIGHTRVRGVEVHGEHDFGDTAFRVAYTLLDPVDLTDPDVTRTLPFVARRVATAGIDQRVGEFTLREASRYQGRVFRDPLNSVEIPAYAVHDLFGDWTRKLGEGNVLALGLSILNATNVQRLGVSSPGTSANDGATSYSDVAGYALPGRQWRLSATVTY